MLQFKDQLIPLWDACLLSEIERTEFITSLYEKSEFLLFMSLVPSLFTCCYY